LPAPHTDSVESFIDYRVAIKRISDLARYNGGVMVSIIAPAAMAWALL
jgi:hypothetical protein